MPAQKQPNILLASNEPDFLNTVEPILIELRANVTVALSAEAALAALTAPELPCLALIDATLPGMDPANGVNRLLQAARNIEGKRRIPVVLISDNGVKQWTDQLKQGVVIDLISRNADPAYLRLRLDSMVTMLRRVNELERLREAAEHEAQTDALTGIFNRGKMLSLLFGETDRVQRMQTPLCLILVDIDDFGHWNSRLGVEACDELLVQTVRRTMFHLRTYDLFGRVGSDELLIALPGCSETNAVLLAERIRREVFSEPFHVAGRSIRLSACFGISSSLGRSPVVVLREAEEVLHQAKALGPESIQCSADCPSAQPGPVAFLSPSSGDDLLAW
jgi:diguanylate cyclase (GGDEF)-like protein